jgi:hypothetical protein
VVSQLQKILAKQIAGMNAISGHLCQVAETKAVCRQNLFETSVRLGIGNIPVPSDKVKP